MAVIDKKEVYTAASAKLDRNNVATYTRLIQVFTDTPKTRQGAAVQALGIAIGDPYKVLDPDDGITVLEQDPAAFCSGISAVPTGGADDGCQWDCTVEYSSFDGDGQFPANPLEHPVTLDYSSSRMSRVPTEDRNGDPMVNSAGESFSKVEPIDDYRILIRLERNEATYSPTYAQNYKGHINLGPFTIAGEIFPAETVKCSDITARYAYNRESGYYWIVNYEFEVNPDGWKVKLLDEGMRYRDGTSGKLNAINDEKGQPVSDPTPLDGNGAQLGVGADPVFLDFDVWPTADFDDFAFDYTDSPGY